MTTLLLTGATGLIGTSLQRIMPLYSDSVHTYCSRAHLSNLRAWNALGKFDYIIHAAGYASPALFTKQPMETAFLNTTALMILLGKLNPGGRLLFLSTSEVYSGCTTKIHAEDDIGTTTPQSPRGIYIESKRCGEAICHAARESGINAMSARVSLAYGPGVKRGDKRVMSELIDQALHDGAIALKDGGQARRTYCYVDDISTMLLNILMRGQHGLYNVGGRSETTISGLAGRIARLTNALVRTPYQSKGRGAGLDGAPQHVSLHMHRYVREFGEPTYTDWETGLERTVAWHRALMGEKVAA
jgi:nucleoside-diphosphate-sugar epimerase